MEGVLIAYGVIAYIVNIIFCCWLANEKQRSVGAWILLGILFPGLSIIAVAGLFFRGGTQVRTGLKISSQHSLSDQIKIHGGVLCGTRE